MTTYRFFVPGKPVPQGSKAMARRADGSMYMYEMLPGLKGWRAAIQVEAYMHHGMSTDRVLKPLSGPVTLTLAFTLPKPKSNRDEFPVNGQTGDLDKLCRAVFDSLQAAGVLANDSQVTRLEATKQYTGDTPGSEEPGVLVTIRSLR